jgi:hypothetical protein
MDRRTHCLGSHRRLWSLPDHVVEAAVRSMAHMDESAGLRRRLAHVREALVAGTSWQSLPGQVYRDALLVAGAKSDDEALEVLRASLPKPEGFMTAFDFDGTVEDLDAHNRAVRERASAESTTPVSTPVLAIRPTGSRPRERRPSCSSRTRGSRRGTLRSASRGGDSGDDGPGSDEPPGLGRRRTQTARRSCR